jgi:CheY-like chemotaxis protein
MKPPPYLLPWVRVLLLIRSITSTTWGHEAWPPRKPLLRRALAMRRVQWHQRRVAAKERHAEKYGLPYLAERKYAASVTSSVGRILIVDDEPPVAGLLRDIVETLGWVAQVVETGPDALRVAPEFKPDVVLLDMTLPELRGEVVLERLHATDPHLPVVMVTGNTDPDLARQTLAQGAFDYLVKPFNLARLRQVLEAAFAYRGA